MQWKQFIILAICILIPRLCNAAFQGFPLAEGSNTSWYAINAQYAPIAQLYSGIVERCSFSAVSPPSWVQTLSVDHTNGTVYEIVVTNAIGPVAYEHGTAYPYVSRAMLGEFDRAIEELIPKFGHSDPTKITYDNNNYEFRLVYNKAELFQTEGIGLVVTNIYPVPPHGNLVTNAIARWTRSPERIWNEVLFEQHYSISNWVTVGHAEVEFSSSHVWYATNVTDSLPVPVFRYGPTSQPPFSITFQGVDLTGEAFSETVTSGESFSNTVKSITNAVPASGEIMDRTWYQVVYTNNITVYGERPYRLYASDLDERWKALDNLRYTYRQAVTYTSEWYYGEGELVANPLPPFDWETLEAEAEADYSKQGNSYQQNTTLKEKGSLFARAKIWGSGSKYRTPSITNLTKDVTFFIHFAEQANPPILGFDFSFFSTGFEMNKFFEADTIVGTTNALVYSSQWLPFNPATTKPGPWVEVPEDPGSSYEYANTLPFFQVVTRINWRFKY